MLRDYIIFRAACSPRGSILLHVRLMPQQYYDKLASHDPCDKAEAVLAQPKMITYKAACALRDKITSKLCEERIAKC